MRIVIQDASVLIDMADCNLLKAWFSLGFDLRTTSLIYHEVMKNNQKLKLQPYLDSGQLMIEKADGNVIAEIVKLRTKLSSRLTVPDASALYFASKLGSILLTGDKLLREHAETEGVETHGLLWVLDTLVARGAILPGVAADRLETLMEHGTSRQPQHQCELRIRKWRR